MRFFMAQRGHRLGLLEPDEGVELLGEDRFEIVAEEFALRPIDDADRTLQSGLAQHLGQVPVGRRAPIGEASRDAGAAEEMLVALYARGAPS